MKDLLSTTYEKLVLSNKTSIRGMCAPQSMVSYQKDDKLMKMEYDVFSRLMEITGIDNNKSQKIKTNNIQTPSVEDCIKELLELERQ